MIVETVIGSGLSLVTGLIILWIWEKKLRNRVTVHRITKMGDHDITSLVELYVRLFPDESTNYSSDDIIEMLRQQQDGGKQKPVRVEDIILVAKCNNDLVGFVFCHYYPDREKAIVSYYGVDRDIREARLFAAKTLLKKLHRLIGNHARPCKYLFFDVDRPGVARTKKENEKRKARIRRFQQDAREFGLCAYCLSFDYSSPRITLSQGTKETPLTLMVVPLRGSFAESILRTLIIEFIRFVYLDCYGDIYETTDPRHADYHKHLFAKIAKYEKTLPERINVEKDKLEQR